MTQEMAITGLEANLLLFGLDSLCETDSQGEVTKGFDGYSLDAIQNLRDRLMAIHEHPTEGR